MLWIINWFVIWFGDVERNRKVYEIERHESFGENELKRV